MAGKQLSIYLDEQQTKRLAEIAVRECRRPNDQARYIILSSLGLTNNCPETQNRNAPLSHGERIAVSA